MAETTKQVGALEFEVLIKNNAIQKQADQTKDIIKEIAQTAENVSGAIDKVSDSTAEAVSDAKGEVSELGKSLKDITKGENKVKINAEGVTNLNKELENISDVQSKALEQLGEVFSENSKEIENANEQLGKERKLLEDISKAGGNSAQIAKQKEIVTNLEAEVDARKQLNAEIKTEEAAIKNQSLSQQIKAVTEAMQQMALEGKENTAEYMELLEKLGQLKDIRGDIQSQGAIFSNDDAKLRATTQGLGGLNSALGVVSTSMQAVGGSSEVLAGAMGAVSSATSIFNGITQVSLALNKDSYLTRMANVKIMGIENALVKTLGVTSKTAGIMVKGALATATAGLTLLLPFIIEGVKQLKDWVRSVTLVSSLNTEMAGGVASNAGANIVLLNKLSREYKALEGDAKKQRDYIRENSESFDTLGVSIKNAETGLINYADANKVLIDQKDAYIQMLMDKAKAEAAYQLQVSKTEEYIKRRLEIENNSTSWEGIKAAFSSGGGFFEGLQNASDYLDGTWLRDWNEAFGNLNDNMRQMADLGNAAGIADLDKTYGEEFEALNAMIEEAQKRMEEFWKKSGLTSNTNANNAQKARDEFNTIFQTAKKGYEDYIKGMNSSNADVRQVAADNAKELLKSGATWEEYLDNMLQKYKGNADAMKVIINEIASLEKQGVMEVFKNDFEVATNYARNATEQLEVIRRIRSEIAANDPLSGEKNKVLDDRLRELAKSSELDIAEANKAYKDYLDEKLKESEKYARQISQIEIAMAQTTSEAEKQILADQLESTTARYNLAVAKEQIDNARNLTDELVRIETERQTRLKAVRNDASKSAEERTAEQDRINEYADAEIEVLRGKYEVAGLEFSDTLQKSVGNAMNKTLAEYVKIIPDLEKELAKLDPNTDEYIKLSATLEALKKGFQNLKDTQNKTWKDFSKKEKWTKVAGYIGEIGNALQDLGGQFKGTTGEIMSLTGELFTSTATIIGSIQKVTDIVTKSIEGVSQATATAIKAVESASVILEVIAVAMQVAMKIVDLFNKNKQTYEDKKDTYSAYVSTLDKIIEREKELTKTLEAQQAVAQYDAVGQMIEKQAERTRQIAKDYLNDRSRGEHTHGYNLASKINAIDAFNYLTGGDMRGGFGDLEKVIGSDKTKAIKDSGRITGLFDLSVDDLRKIQTEAIDFYANLDDEVREYIEQIISYEDAMVQNTKDKMEQVNGISFESFADNFVSALEDMEATAEDISKDISEQMRKGLINDMFKREYAQKLQEYYDAWYEDAKDGKIDDQNYLNGLRDSIVNGAVESAKVINDMFRDTTEDIENDKTLSGAIKGASQESIDLLAGQTNAVRMNQVEQIAILRAQTETMNVVNDSIIRNGMILSDILDAVRNSGVNMRSQGLGI